jgi:lipopolysaccharide/colanic/teichoic acid biosynthesis glycosyltransferase
MGLNGKRFTILKLRTMIRNPSTSVDGLFAGWTYENDPRILPVGRVLRRFRIDELPQMLNVLKGDMSLIGPRPEPYDVAASLQEQIPGYEERHRVRPGLTGRCQVDRCYSDFGTIEKQAIKAAVDIAYVRELTLLSDIKIALATVPVLLRGGGVR